MKNTRKIHEKYVNYYHSCIIHELFTKNLIYNVIQNLIKRHHAKSFNYY